MSHAPSLVLSLAVLGAACSAPSAAANPTADWTVYHSDTLGLSFEYPAVREVAASAACRPLEESAGSSVTVGRVRVASVPARTDLDLAVDEWAARGPAVNITQRIPTRVADLPAIAVEYQNAGTGRAGAMTFVAHRSRVISIGFDAGGSFTCGGASMPRAADVYLRIASTLRFD